MAKHGRNSTANPVYSYRERKKDSEQSEFGSVKKRLTADSCKKLNQCSLTHQKCIEPVITKDGHIFEKEALFEYILKRKMDYKAKLSAYRKANSSSYVEEEKLKLAHVTKVKKFMESDSIIATDSTSEVSHDKKLTSFWIPSLTPQSQESKPQKPVNEVLCPLTQKPLKIQELICVKFKTIEANGVKSFVCSVTGDELNNTVSCAVLAPGGDVVTMECVEKLIKKPGKDFMINPITGEKLNDCDIIPIRGCGTGFSASDSDHVAVVKNPAMLLA